MIARRLLHCLFLITTCVATGQTSGPVIRGTVVDQTDAALGGADVRLMSSTGALVTSGVADAKGAFRITPPGPGAFLTRIRVAGFLTLEIPTDIPSLATEAQIGKHVMFIDPTFNECLTICHGEKSLIEPQEASVCQLLGSPERFRMGVRVTGMITRDPIDPNFSSLRSDGCPRRLLIPISTETYGPAEANYLALSKAMEQGRSAQVTLDGYIFSPIPGARPGEPVLQLREVHAFSQLP